MLMWTIMYVQATKLARAMVTKYGMSSVLGPTSIAYEDNGRSLSSETRAAVEGEVSPAQGPRYHSPILAGAQC